MTLVRRLGLLMYSAVMLVTGFNMFLPSSAAAQVHPDCTRAFLNFPTWYAYLEVQPVPPDNNCEILGPDENGDGRVDIAPAVGRVALAILDILLRLAGIAAFGFIIYSGFKFVLSQGDPGKEKEARDTAINAVIGMVIAIFAVVIVSFIGRTLVG